MKTIRLQLLIPVLLALMPALAEGKDAKLFLLGGQSNMDGCGRWHELPEELRKLPETVRIWDNREAKWVAIGEDTTAIARNKLFGPEVVFAHRMAAAFPDHEILLVKTSAGGTKLQHHWLPGKPMYERFTANWRKAAAGLDKAGTKQEIAGMLWMQGESDSETLEMANAYGENLKTMIRDVRAKTGRADLPIVMGRISSSLLKKTPWNFDHARVVQKAQEAVAAGVPGVSLTNTDKLTTLPDNTHFDTQGQITLGGDMAGLMLEALAKNKKEAEFRDLRGNVSSASNFLPARSFPPR